MPARVSVFINTLRVICVSSLLLHSLAPLPSSASRESVKDCRSALWAPARYLLVLTPILTLRHRRRRQGWHKLTKVAVSTHLCICNWAGAWVGYAFRYYDTVPHSPSPS